jgi:hypothetical protein
MADRHRLFRFSLKTLLILMTALAVWFGLYTKRLHDRRSAILALEQMDASLGVATGGPVWLRPLLRDERYFWEVSGVFFNESRQLKDDELQKVMELLKDFNDITNVKLAGSQVTDAGLANLRVRSDTLRVLDIRNTAISDDGVRNLIAITALRDIHIQGSAITDAGVSKLQQALPDCRIHR